MGWWDGGGGGGGGGHGAAGPAGIVMVEAGNSWIGAPPAAPPAPPPHPPAPQPPAQPQPQGDLFSIKQNITGFFTSKYVYSVENRVDENCVYPSSHFGFSVSLVRCSSLFSRSVW